MLLNQDPEIRSGLQEELDALRVALQADGADLVLDDVGGNGQRVHLSLVVSDETCLDCIMPKDHLESIILENFREKYPVVEEVVLNDPRLA
jgi:hypothetical protein